jgi:hypothetical protein
MENIVDKETKRLNRLKIILWVIWFGLVLFTLITALIQDAQGHF